MNASTWRATFVALGMLSLASATSCEETSGGSGGASAQEVDDCKEACNQLKFFDCNDSTDQAACFSACEAASSSQIELFTACVEADICDPTCSTELEGSAGETSGGSGVSDGGSGGSSCVSACQAYANDCSEDAVDCTVLCSALTPEEQTAVVYCESQRDGCDLPEECVGDLEPDTDDPVVECQDACDSMHFFDCLTAQQHADCRTLCETVDDTTRDTFTGCADSGICEDSSCYDVMSDGA